MRSAVISCVALTVLLSASDARTAPASPDPRTSAQSAAGADPGSRREDEAPLQLVAVLHAHTTASSGSETPARLAQMARQSGIDLLLLTENLGYEFRYAPWPLRLVAEFRRSATTVEHFGIDRYLAEIAEIERHDPSLILLAGAEVPPFYYWTGSLTGGDLTLHDVQRNVLVVPAVGDPDAGELLESLPIVGNRGHSAHGVQSLALLLPGLIAGAWSISRLKRAGMLPPRSLATGYHGDGAEVRHVRTHSPLRSPAVWVQITVLVAAALLLYANFPYAVPTINPYDPEKSYEHFEALFEHVTGRGGLTFWSMPEAVDYQDRSVGPFTVRLSTDPYDEALTATRGYTGFGGVYADTITAFAPGASWDRAIAAFQRGERDAPPWLIGESAFHFSGQAGKQLDDIVTELLVRERSRQAAFEALAGGHSYALRREAGSADLRLLEFSASLGGGTATARPGQVIDVGSDDDFEVTLRIEDARGSAVPVEIELIRRGVVHRSWSETTPFEGRWPETLETGESEAYYRVVVRAATPAYLVSNPIFVTRGAGSMTGNSRATTGVRVDSPR